MGKIMAKITILVMIRAKITILVALPAKIIGDLAAQPESAAVRR